MIIITISSGSSIITSYIYIYIHTCICICICICIYIYIYIHIYVSMTTLWASGRTAGYLTDYVLTLYYGRTALVPLSAIDDLSDWFVYSRHRWPLYGHLEGYYIYVLVLYRYHVIYMMCCLLSMIYIYIYIMLSIIVLYIYHVICVLSYIVM